MGRFFRRDEFAVPRSWPRRLLIGFNVILIMVLVAGVAGFGYVKWRWGQISKLNLSGVLDSASSKQPMTILLVGSDSRSELEKGQSKEFGSASQVSGQRSDTIMLLRVDPKNQRAAILSLPRDLWVSISGTSGKQRINTAFDKGPEPLIKTIQQNFNIPIDHYAEVNFDSFRSLVSAVGGVNVPFSAPARDTLSGLYVKQAGCVKLSGDQALSYVRSRHYELYESGRWQDDPRSDLSRIDRQQDFIRRVIRKVVAESSTNPVALNNVISAGVQNLKIDSGLKLNTITSLAKKFKSLDPSKVEMMTLPTKAANVGGADVLLPLQPDAKETIDRFLNGPKAQTAANIPPSSISVRVLNGSGRAGEASTASGELIDAGFVVSGTGDGTRGSSTVIHYAAGNEDKAAVVARYINGPVTKVQDTSIKGVDIILVTGSGFSGVNVSGTTTSTTAPATTTTTAKPSPFIPADIASCQ